MHPADKMSTLVDSTPEFRLLLSCARTQIDVSTGAQIEAALCTGIDWERLLRLADEQQVLSLVASTLCGSYADDCPPEIVQRLWSFVRDSAACNVFAARKMLEVLDLFESAGIPVIPYKGPLLLATVYRKGGLRDFGDLDVWVHPWDDHFRVGKLLAEHGWSLTADFGFQRTFTDSTSEVVLDIHRSLTRPRQLPFLMQFESALQRCAAVDIAGRTVRTLSPMDLLLALCVQLAKDAAGTGRGPSLIKVCDIAELVRTFPDLDWGALTRQARRLGVLHVVCLGLGVAAKLLGTRVPKEIALAGGNVADLDSLVRHVEERIFGGEDAPYSRPELLDARNWNAAIRERFRDRNDAMIALAQFALEPSDSDFAFVRLPRRLFPLYRLVRPVRVVWKYGQSLMRRQPRDRASP